jgi:polysaccharide deacetylase 2 family uncharacterized protein YibQ
VIAFSLSRGLSARRNRCAFALSLAVVFALISFIAGCKKSKPLTASEIHAITNEFSNAAKSEGPLNVVATRTTLDATDKAQGSTDHVAITLRQPSSEAAQHADRALVLQALDDVAARHELTRSGMIESREGLAFKYLRADVATHTIRITELTIPTVELAPAPAGPRLAIILDDLGQDYSAAEAIFALPYPLTISVLPNNPHSVDIAEEAHRRGYEVMLHLPMESVSQRRAESHELRPGMSQRDVSSLVEGFISAVPGVGGVNNHQGSESTANTQLMNELMRVLHEHKLFYIDSRTTAATVAFDAARRAGVPTAYRNVPFLDDVTEVGAVSRQLRLAIREAREKNDAIAIGHPHPATLKALREILPEAKAQGVRLVYASELVR